MLYSCFWRQTEKQNKFIKHVSGIVVDWNRQSYKKVLLNLGCGLHSRGNQQHLSPGLNVSEMRKQRRISKRKNNCQMLLNNCTQKVHLGLTTLANKNKNTCHRWTDHWMRWVISKQQSYAQYHKLFCRKTDSTLDKLKKKRNKKHENSILRIKSATDYRWRGCRYWRNIFSVFLFVLIDGQPGSDANFRPLNVFWGTQKEFYTGFIYISSWSPYW